MFDLWYDLVGQGKRSGKSVEKNTHFEVWQALLTRIRKAGDVVLGERDTSLNRKTLVHKIMGYGFSLEVELKRLAQVDQISQPWQSILRRELKKFDNFTAQEILRIFRSQSRESCLELSRLLRASWLKVSSLGNRQALTLESATTGEDYRPTDWIHLAHDAMIKALVNRSACLCEQPHTSKSFGVRIPLKTYRTHTSESACSVTIYLKTEQSWEEALVSIRKVSNEEIPEIVIEDSGSNTDSLDPNTEDTVVSICMECSFAQRFARRLHLGVEYNGSTTLFRLDPQPKKHGWEWSQAITLQELLENRGFSPRERRLLAVRLTYAILHFFNTLWLHKSWNSSNIMFPIGATGVHLAPHIETQHDRMIAVTEGDRNLTGDTDPEHTVYMASKGPGHPLPFLVVLAIQLLEIHQRSSFTDLVDNCPVDVLAEVDDLSIFFDAQTVCKFFREDGGLDQNDEIYYEAISRCLDKSLWTGIDDVYKLREKMYENIVAWLELRLIKEKISLLDLDKIGDALAMTRNDLARLASRDIAACLPQPPKDLAGRSETKCGSATVPCTTVNGRVRSSSDRIPQPEPLLELFDDAQPNDIQSKAIGFGSWGDDFTKVYEKFISNQGEVKDPIKIGVIDTGYDATHWAFEAVPERIVKKCCSDSACLADPDKCQPGHMTDKHGHGTHVAGLLLAFARDAQLFIVKLDTTLGDVSQKKVAQALYLLADTWKVNIISLSFGYSLDTLGAYGDIKTAISHASQRALIFAAARNNGINQPRAWPAQEPGVFGVYSTDHNGAWSTFNPPEMFESINLAIIGEAVLSYWPENLCDESMMDHVAVKSGTSYATPIAACLAAFLLMFTQKYLGPKELQRLKKFKHMRRVITAVFEASWDKDHKRPDYTYLAFSLKPKNLFSNGKIEEIVDVIRGALEKKIARG